VRDQVPKCELLGVGCELLGVKRELLGVGGY
jgi:hypothetical protein